MYGAVVDILDGTSVVPHRWERICYSWSLCINFDLKIRNWGRISLTAVSAWISSCPTSPGWPIRSITLGSLTFPNLAPVAAIWDQVSPTMRDPLGTTTVSARMYVPASTKTILRSVIVEHHLEALRVVGDAVACGARQHHGSSATSYPLLGWEARNRPLPKSLAYTKSLAWELSYCGFARSA